ncbi:hypothetical protein [Amycolatopsis orientalis]|uniref:hypothetical protein n=1 Tax=Amycolatopsis orientalis TaxID=31958 RepID=UPI0012693295|nr:hypothetical protein [Amycolatopsis orientalis]
MSVEPASKPEGNQDTPPAETTCPTPTAHKRLEEGHRWWHGCLDNYDDPPAFRANLNACLQALRNVTWVLQKEKRLVPEFDSWYPPQQDTMRGDPLLKWLVNSRNRVVKSGDLELLSTAQMQLILQYKDVAAAVTQSLPSATSTQRVKALPLDARPEEYHKFLANIPTSVLNQSSIFIERSWIDKALPDKELLNALAHCYGTLSDLLDSAHEQAGIEGHSVMAHGVKHDSTQLSTHGGRLPCMVTTLDMRTAHYRFGDAKLVRGEYRKLEIPKTIAKRTVKRYGLDQFKTELNQDKSSLFDFMEPLMNQACRFLQSDKAHIFVTFLFKGPELVHIQSAVFNDRASKHAYARELANQVAANSIDGVITLGEVWQSGVVIDEEGAVIPPGEVPDRREALEVYAESKTGENRSLTTYFHRRFGRIIFDETISCEDQSTENNFMSPVRAVWASEKT